MKRIILFTFAMILLMSVSSLATNTRVMTMGENNTILLDEANIWEFPSRINDYPNIAVAEFDYPNSFEDFGVHWQFNQDYPWILGTYFHNSDVVVPPSDPFGYGTFFYLFPFNDGGDPSSSLLPNQRIDLFYGRKLGAQQNPFGVRLSAIHSSQEDKVIGAESKESFAIYDLALGLTLGGGLTDIAAGITLMSWSDEDLLPTAGTVFDESKPKGNYQMYAMARRFWQITPTYTGIPHVGLSIGKNEAEYYTEDGAGAADSLFETAKFTWFDLDLGFGLQYAPSNDAMVVIDFGIEYFKLDGEYDNNGNLLDAKGKSFSIPYFKMGGDLKVFNWMDLRLGSTSYWERTTFEATTSGGTIEDYAMNYPSNETYLGFGFHWGNLHVDTYTDPNVFMNGFNFISGNSSLFNWQLSALYEIM